MVPLSAGFEESGARGGGCGFRERIISNNRIHHGQSVSDIAQYRDSCRFVMPLEILAHSFSPQFEPTSFFMFGQIAANRKLPTHPLRDGEQVGLLLHSVFCRIFDSNPSRPLQVIPPGSVSQPSIHSVVEGLWKLFALRFGGGTPVVLF